VTQKIEDEESGWTWAERWRKKAHQLARVIWPLAAIAAVGWGVAIYLLAKRI
jgi:hypothetical protein